MTAVFTLAIGALVFPALTPGMISMAPGLAEAVSRTTAIADFPLGPRSGASGAGCFPPVPRSSRWRRRSRARPARFGRRRLRRRAGRPGAGVAWPAPPAASAPARNGGGRDRRSACPPVFRARPLSCPRAGPLGWRHGASGMAPCRFCASSGAERRSLLSRPVIVYVSRKSPQSTRSLTRLKRSADHPMET